MAFGMCKSLLFVAVFLTVSSCWISSAGGNPVPTEGDNQLDELDRNDSFIAGDPLTEEEFQSGATGNKGALLENGLQPWEHQENSGLVGGDNLPDTGKKNANKNAGQKWPSARIPYVISNTFSTEERRVIASAMAIYHKKTCIRFVPRRTQQDYIKIMRSRESQNGWANYPGCWAQKGHVGGAQEVSLDNRCVYPSVILHELMHVSGFDHEQERPDQHKYITVNFKNIKPENHQWFTSKPRDAINTIGKYNINSIMHYGAYAYAIDSSIPTMVAKNGQTNIGSGDGFASTDIQKLNKLYSCSGY